MSDEKDGAVATVGLHYAPECCVDGCDDWGIAGFSSSRHVEARWWCWEHYPYKREAPEPSEVAEVAETLGRIQ
jgi:hypothetical protein